jgi:hypothetical protein
MKRSTAKTVEGAEPCQVFFLERHNEAFMAENDGFGDCVERGATPLASFEDDRRALMVTATVRADSYGMGAQGAEDMARRLQDKACWADDSCIVLERQGSLATPNGLDRSDGFSKTLAAATALAKAPWCPPSAGALHQTAEMREDHTRHDAPARLRATAIRVPPKYDHDIDLQIGAGDIVALVRPLWLHRPRERGASSGRTCPADQRHRGGVGASCQPAVGWQPAKGRLCPRAV